MNPVWLKSPYHSKYYCCVTKNCYFHKMYRTIIVKVNYLVYCDFLLRKTLNFVTIKIFIINSSLWKNSRRQFYTFQFISIFFFFQFSSRAPDIRLRQFRTGSLQSSKNKKKKKPKSKIIIVKNNSDGDNIITE